MRIAVIGAGNVGGTLGRRWAALGHDVVFGLRDPSEEAVRVKGGSSGDAPPSGTTVATVADAARGADVVVLTTPWAAVREVLRDLGALEGMILVDATNPIAAGFRIDAGPGGTSGAEQVQALAPGARVVKAFNTTGWENMRNPTYSEAPTAMFVAGDDGDARKVVLSLATSLGFDAIDAGPLVRARELEHLAMLWISLAMGIGVAPLGRDIAFRLVHR